MEKVAALKYNNKKLKISLIFPAFLKNLSFPLIENKFPDLVANLYFFTKLRKRRDTFSISCKSKYKNISYFMQTWNLVEQMPYFVLPFLSFSMLLFLMVDKHISFRSCIHMSNGLIVDIFGISDF